MTGGALVTPRLVPGRDGHVVCPMCGSKMEAIEYRDLAFPAWSWIYWRDEFDHLSAAIPVPAGALATLWGVSERERDLVQHPGVAGAAP